MDGKRVRIGTRGSLLAQTQTEWVVSRLRAAYPDRDFTIEIIQTTGDMRRDVPFARVGTKGMFVKEIEMALLDGTIDLGIHSLKDMPSDLPPGLTLIGVPQRENPFDALVSSHGIPLSALPSGAIVGTSSIRRQAQLLCFRPDLKVTELRGNLDTRLRKLDAGEYDAIVLASAGLRRLGLAARITQELPVDISTPAVGQGALALEARTDAPELRALVQAIHDVDTADCVAAERAFQAALHGGCTVPAGAYAYIEEGHLVMHAVIAAPDGTETLREERTGERLYAVELGIEVANRLLSRGGKAYLQG